MAALVAGWGMIPALASAAQTEVTAPNVSAAGSYLAGWYAQRIEEWGAAARYIHRAHLMDPDQRQLLHRAFLLRVADGRVAESLSLAEQMLDEAKPSTLAMLVLMLDRLDRSDVAGAQAFVSDLPDTGIGKYIQPMLRAWFLSESGQTEQAVVALAGLADSTGFAVLKDLHAGELFGRNGDFERAAAAFDSALETSGQSLRILLAATRFLVNNGKTEEALAVLETVERDHPPDISVQGIIDQLATGQSPAVMEQRSLREGIAGALFDIASAFIQERSELVGMIYLRAALFADPDFRLARMQLADLLAQTGQPESAVDAYRSVMEDVALRYSAGLHLADALQRLDRSAEALAVLQGLAEAYPHRLNPMFRIANLHRLNQEWSEAIEAYTVAMQRPPAAAPTLKWRLLYGRAIAHDRMQHWEAAEADLLAALEIDPDQPDVLNYLGYSWADKGVHLERAKEMIVRAVAQRPRNGYIVDSLGWVEYRLGDLDAAVRELERAIELEPADPTINDHLGDVYWAVGRRLEAIYQWRRALRYVGEDDGDLARAVEEKLLKHDWQAEDLRRAGTDLPHRS